MYFSTNTFNKKRLKIYLEYYFKAESKYNFHSPFLYNFIEFVFDTKRLYYDFNTLSEASNFIQSSHELLPTDPVSILRNQSGLTVSSMYERSGHSIYQYESLYRLVLYLQPHNILELGSCTGMSALSMALANKSGIIKTIEGNATLSKWCNALFNKFHLNHVECIHSDFNSYLNSLHAASFDLAFIDGDHTYDASINNTDKLLHYTSDRGVIILDDIHWSEGMYKAWKELIAHPLVHTSLETERWGILFKNKSITEGNFVFIETAYKPWKIGVF